MKHYTKEELDCYRHHEMTVLGRINCAAHLKECHECAKLLVELEQDDTFVSELRESIRIYKEAMPQTHGTTVTILEPEPFRTPSAPDIPPKTQSRDRE